MLTADDVEIVEEVTFVQPNLSDEFAALLTDYSPLQRLHDMLVESLGESHVIKIIVSFVGYCESTISEGKYVSGHVCSSPTGYELLTLFFGCHINT